MDAESAQNVAVTGAGAGTRAPGPAQVFAGAVRAVSLSSAPGAFCPDVALSMSTTSSLDVLQVMPERRRTAPATTLSSTAKASRPAGTGSWPNALSTSSGSSRSCRPRRTKPGPSA